MFIKEKLENIVKIKRKIILQIIVPRDDSVNILVHIISDLSMHFLKINMYL